MSDPLAIGLVFLSYLMGSIPFGLLIGKMRKVDVRQVGSGNIGATNVARNLGKKTGALVLVLDAGKGAIPTLVARQLAASGDITLEAMAVIALASIVGHCFPLWLRFRGGKGVATSLGVFLVVDPLIAGIGVLIFVGLYLTFRVASIGSVTAAITFPILLYVLDRPLPLVHLGLVGAAIVVVKHRQNLLRVLHGGDLSV